MDSTLARFLLVGVANSAVGLATIYAAKLLAGVDDVRANILGYAVGLAVSFLLNRRWTFHHEGRAITALLRFLAVFAVAYLANLATVLLLIEELGVNAYFSQAMGVVPYTLLFYLGSRWYAFQQPKPPGVR